MNENNRNGENNDDDNIIIALTSTTTETNLHQPQSRSSLNDPSNEIAYAVTTTLSSSSISNNEDDEEIRERLLQDIAILQEQQNESLRTLLLLRVEQFWIRHHQISTLMEIIEDFGSNCGLDETKYEHIRYSLMKMSLDVMSTLQGLLQHAAGVQRRINNNAVAESIAMSQPTSEIKGMKIEHIKRLPLMAVPFADEIQKCAICLADYEMSCISGDDTLGGPEKIRLLPCSHFFHPKCVDPWLLSNATCPCCRYSVENAMQIALEKSEKDRAALLSQIGSFSSTSNSRGVSDADNSTSSSGLGDLTSSIINIASSCEPTLAARHTVVNNFNSVNSNTGESEQRRYPLEALSSSFSQSLSSISAIDGGTSCDSNGGNTDVSQSKSIDRGKITSNINITASGSSSLIFCASSSANPPSLLPVSAFNSVSSRSSNPTDVLENQDRVAEARQRIIERSSVLRNNSSVSFSNAAETSNRSIYSSDVENNNDTTPVSTGTATELRERINNLKIRLGIEQPCNMMPAVATNDSTSSTRVIASTSSSTTSIRSRSVVTRTLSSDSLIVHNNGFVPQTTENVSNSNTRNPAVPYVSSLGRVNQLSGMLREHSMSDNSFGFNKFVNANQQRKTSLQGLSSEEKKYFFSNNSTRNTSSDSSSESKSASSIAERDDDRNSSR